MLTSSPAAGHDPAGDSRQRENEFDFRGSVHHSIIHIEIANKMQQFIKSYYSMFI
jgi:hypothetical protein